MSSAKRSGVAGADALLDGLTDPAGELARLWDAEHDRHVVGCLMASVQPAFQPTTWEAFWRTTVDGQPPARVAADMNLTPNAVFIARSRVMQRLRQEAAGLVDEP